VEKIKKLLLRSYAIICVISEILAYNFADINLLRFEVMYETFDNYPIALCGAIR